MGVRVEASNASEEMLKGIQAVAEELYNRGYAQTQLQQHLANTYVCGVSVTYTRENIVFTLHSNPVCV